jgi:ABC-2 type transport system permease protein
MVADVVPILLTVLVVLFVVYRRTRTGTGNRPGVVNPPAGPRVPVPHLLPLPGDIGLVAARELRERARGRAFRVGTLLVLVIVGAAIIIPALLGGGQRTERVGVTGNVSAPVRTAVTADGAAVSGGGVSVTLVTEPSAQAAAADLRAGRIDLAVTGTTVATDKAVAAADTSATAQLARAAARTVGTAGAMTAAGLSPAQAAALARARPATLTSLAPAGPGTTQRNTSFVGLLLVFFMLTQYNAWTLTGVLEEKSSRVVEVLLAAVTPARLLAGKVLGIGLAALVQAAVTVGVAAGLARAVHSDVLAGLSPLAVTAAVTWLLLGYAFYSWVYAAAGSTVDRQEQAQSLLLPLALPVIAGYLVATSAVSSGNPSLLLHVLAYLPPTAPFAMPALVSLGAATWWQFALSAALSLACTAGTARVAIAIYTASILRSGGRPGLGRLLAGRATLSTGPVGKGVRHAGPACGQTWGQRWITCAYGSRPGVLPGLRVVVHKYQQLWMICTVRRKLAGVLLRQLPEDDVVGEGPVHPGGTARSPFAGEAGALGHRDHAVVVRQRLQLQPVQPAGDEPVPAQHPDGVGPEAAAAEGRPERDPDVGAAVMLVDAPQQRLARQLAGVDLLDRERGGVPRERVLVTGPVR